MLKYPAEHQLHQEEISSEYQSTPRRIKKENKERDSGIKSDLKHEEQAGIEEDVEDEVTDEEQDVEQIIEEPGMESESAPDYNTFSSSNN